MAPLRVGYVPEHFSTPLHFAQTYCSLSADLIPFPSGTGHMVTALRAGELDIAIGLTEGWIAAIAKGPPPSQTTDAGSSENEFKLVGTYVETPLCWAISTGHDREHITDVQDLKGKKLGVSRIGSGSYVMSYVLADREGWDQPFECLPLQTFEALRKGVNDRTVDFFMWEYFTSKRYYSSDTLHPIKKVGEIYTPWSSWKICARTPLIDAPELISFLEKVNAGIRYFEEHKEEAVQYISTKLDYEKEDAKEWMKTVRFAKDVKGVKDSVVRETMEMLQKAGVIEGEAWPEGSEVNKAKRFVGILKEEHSDV
ncbi:MAG: hypothetical protein L6R38_005776 [Xanthoria sp. 2 TBL-2021]|nr:MAG: hypothetical protein L6R38_005776 [Xanthoria sp. 2 TBL-2021]